MPTRIPSHRPLRVSVRGPKRDESARPNAHQRGYCDKAHRAWRQAVLTRDAWACVDCGRIDQANHADHVVPVSVRPDLRYEVSNGACRCISCHSSKTARENAAKCNTGRGGSDHGACR